MSFWRSLQRGWIRGVVVIALLAGSFLAFESSAEASINQQISYQARLWTSTGAPVADGTYSVKFSLYSDAGGSTRIWTAAGSLVTPTAISVSVTNGAFSIALGDVAGGQNTLVGVNWDQSALYLGISVGADAEMTPLRRLTSVPQAFLADNALMLQGMSASSTAYGGQSLFTIHQTETSAATGTRTALEVRSEGTSTANDYLFRGINNLGTTVFSLSRDGTVTSTNLIATTSVSSSRIIASDILQARGATITGLASSTFLDFTSMVTSTSYGTTLNAGLEELTVIGNRLYVPLSSSIRIFDIADPKSERYLGSISLSGSTLGSYAVRGNLVYVHYRDNGSVNRFSIYDAKDPTSPKLLGYLDLSGSTVTMSDIAVYNQVAYVGSGSGSRIYVVDITNPSAPFLTNEVAPSGPPVRLYIDGRTLYLTRNQGPLAGTFQAYDIEDPTLPVLRASFPIGETPQTIVRAGSTLYTMNQGGPSMTLINIQNPVSPVLVQTISLAYVPKAAVTIGDRLIIGGDDGALHLYNVASSTAPVSLGAYTINSGNDVIGLTVIGQSLVVFQNGPSFVLVYTIPGMSVDALSAGSGAFRSLEVQGGIKIAENADIAGSLAVGQGGILSQGGVIANATSTEAVAGSFVNTASSSLSDRSWGLYTNRLLAGESLTATGSKNYVAMFTHNSAQSRFGVCIDNTNTASTCLNFANTSTIYSLLADEAIGANAFDLAERYEITGDAAPGDLLILDPDQPRHMRKSPGVPYDARISGVVSTRPGFLLGSGGDASVALVGRVPLRVTVSNGAIRVGDPLTSSAESGVAMRATQAGMIIGHALEATTVDGLIETYLQPGFDASSWLQADGSMTMIAQDTGLQAQAVADAVSPLQSSRALAFRGSAWDGSRPIVSEFRLFNDLRSSSSSALTITSGTSSSSLFALSQNGSVSLAGDLALAGRLYPSARGRAQNESYLFVDDTSPSGNYISTNADGWQSQDGYDYAEQYPSPDALEPGDLVVVQRSHRLYVQRSLNDEDLPIGIVSTKPGFIAGRTQEGSYPIALAGRVPTHVSTMNGAIAAGDPLAPSSIPGVAVKATRPGPVVGLALESYTGSEVGKIEVFVNPTWWGGASTEATRANTSALKTKEGFAGIVAGKTRVHIDLPNFTRYPHLQVTPYAQVEQGWWIDHVSPAGFDIILGAANGNDLRFAWTANETADETEISLSNGRTFTLDPLTGEMQLPPGEGIDGPTVVDTPPSEEISSSPAPEGEEEVDVPAEISPALPSDEESTVIPIDTPVTETPSSSEVTTEETTSSQETVASSTTP